MLIIQNGLWHLSAASVQASDWQRYKGRSSTIEFSGRLGGPLGLLLIVSAAALLNVVGIRASVSSWSGAYQVSGSDSARLPWLKTCADGRAIHTAQSRFV